MLFLRLAVCGDERQESAPQSEGRRDRRSGIGQHAERSSHLTWIQLARLRLGFRLCRERISSGIELNLSYATAHHWNAMKFGAIGVSAQRGSCGNEKGGKSGSAIADHQLRFGGVSYDESVEQGRKIIQMDSTFPIGHKQLGDAYLLKQMDKEAVAELQKAVRLSGMSAARYA
jgi:hypothetical protein